MRFVLASHNVQNTPDLPRHDVMRCGHLLRGADIVGLQEIRENQDSTDVLKGLGILWRMVLKNVSTQIAFKRLTWQHITHSTLKLHNGDAHIPTPARWIGWTMLRRRRSLRLPKFIFVDTHFVNGAFNSQHDESKSKRRQLWHQSNAIMDEFLQRMSQAGHFVFVVGDFNNKYMEKYTQSQVWIHNKGIDKMFAIMPTGWELKVNRTWKVNTPSDHNALFADISVVRSK